VNWLQQLDVAGLRFINQTLSNSAFDAWMPFVSGNKYFFLAVFIATALLLWKGGVRGRLCVLMLILIVGPGDGIVCNLVKNAIARPRPFLALDDIHVLVGRGASFSMPSSHAANWFAATMILLVYFRRSWWIMLPLACIVSFSRVYNGVHYPSDVIVGAVLGAGYSAAGLWLFNSLWQWIGPKWFPLWWVQLPSLVPHAALSIGTKGKATEAAPDSSDVDRHWLRLGYGFIIFSLVAKLAYINSGLVELSGDEAYQWMWSKHPALSYISKPPLIAYTQFLGTALWGDTEFGIRFFSPIIGAVIGFLVLRFFAKEVNARAGFFLILIVSATPLMALGSILLTVDSLSVLFWTAAMIAGWRAMQPESGIRPWLWTGLWLGFGFLSKYTALFQWLCWAMFFVLWKPARVHLRRPGPYLALAINALCTLPVIIWNHQHGWITVSHVVNHNANLDEVWRPTLRYVLEFLGAEWMLLNPVFFIAILWAAIAFWRRHRHDPRLVYFFSMGAPLFLSYFLFSFRSRIMPNWIAPSVLPLFCLMVIYWDTIWRLGKQTLILKPFLRVGLIVGFVGVAVLHEADLVKHVVGRPLPPKPDPMTRVRGYAASAKLVNKARAQLLAEGKPVFIIGGHYQTASLLTFYLLEAKTNVVRDPLIYYLSSDVPENQFFFWPGYKETHKGENAIFVRELPPPPLVSDWFFRWLKGERHLIRLSRKGRPAPQSLLDEFESVTDRGQVNAIYRGRVFHTYQIFECRNLR
jgi:membrane-associated phospholipid phosphatase